jgi:hypothetical protein
VPNLFSSASPQISSPTSHLSPPTNQAVPYGRLKVYVHTRTSQIKRCLGPERKNSSPEGRTWYAYRKGRRTRCSSESLNDSRKSDAEPMDSEGVEGRRYSEWGTVKVIRLVSSMVLPFVHWPVLTPDVVPYAALSPLSLEDSLRHTPPATTPSFARTSHRSLHVSTVSSAACSACREKSIS